MFCSIEMDINDQISLFTDLSGSFEIKKHSSFIQMYSNTSLMQRKIMDAIIYIVKDQLKRNPDQRLFATELGIIKKLAGIGRKDNKELKAALRLLTTLSIEYNVL